MASKKTVRKIIIAAALMLAIISQAVAGMAASGGIAYTNSKYGFSLTLPTSWAGLYRMEERDSGVSFFNIKNENAGYGGFLFGIFVSDQVEPIDWGYREITRSGGLYYYSARPSDVQFAYENTALTNEYNAMEKDIDSIIRTFRLAPANASTGTTSNAVASPTASTVYINGSIVAFDAYNIDDFNYFKLRDIAFAINGTEKQFEVGWSEAANAISLSSGRLYTVVSGEMSGRGSGNKVAAPTNSRIFLNGTEIYLTAYNIDGYNYFKLRDVGEAINFGVDWDEARNAITINTGKGYDAAAASSPGAGTSDRASIVRDYQSELVGQLWHRSDVLAAGWSDRFLLAPDKKFIYATNQMDGETRTRAISGTWEIEGDYLVLNFRQAIVWEGGETIPATGSTATATEIVNATLAVKTITPAEQHRILIGNYIYSAGVPHPWSVNFETSDKLFEGWWHKYEGEYDYNQLIADYNEMAGA